MYSLLSSCKKMTTSGIFCRKASTLFCHISPFIFYQHLQSTTALVKGPVVSYNFILREEAQTQRKEL